MLRLLALLLVVGSAAVAQDLPCFRCLYTCYNEREALDKANDCYTRAGCPNVDVQVWRMSNFAVVIEEMAAERKVLVWNVGSVGSALLPIRRVFHW